MNLKEKLAEKKDALKALEENIKAGDADAIAQGEEIVSAIAELEKSIEAAEKANNLLAQIGNIDAPEEDKNMEGLKALNLEYLKTNRGSVETYVKAATDTVTGPTIPTVSQNVGEIKYNLRVRELFGTESISGNSLTYYVMGTTEGTPAATAQGAEKPQIHPQYTSKTVALSKIAAHLKETEELLNDAPYLESVVRGRGAYEVQKAIESYLITTLLGTSGIDTSVNTGISFDNLLRAKTEVLDNTGYDADAVIINPADLQTLLLAKDSNNQYLMGGPAYAPYGNGTYGQYLPIWGMKVVASSSISSGTAIVGAFKQCASVVTKAGEGFRVEVANQNEDDFVKNMITVRIEERVLEAVRLPGGFAKVYTA